MKGPSRIHTAVKQEEWNTFYLLLYDEDKWSNKSVFNKLFHWNCIKEIFL